jgi:hypothetical protein
LDLIPSDIICREYATPTTASKDKMAQGAKFRIRVETAIPGAIIANELVVMNEDALVEDRS